MTDQLAPIDAVLRTTAPDMSEELRARLTTALVEREDEMADLFRLAGIQFGLYPWIMAKVFADVGIGTPPTDEGRTLIDAQFVTGMEELRRAWEQGQQG